MTTTFLRVAKLRKTFDPSCGAVVDDLSFTLADNEIMALVGPSGCGKTTLLRLLAGFERPDGGTIELGGTVISDESTFVKSHVRKMGFVFQDYALFPHLDVLHNVTFGLSELPAAKRRDRALFVLSLLGLESYASRRPDELSGGQQQRVALARAVAPGPKLLLLDEPFSGLDAGLRVELRTEVRSLLKREGIAGVLVTHDQEEALGVGDRVGVMSAGRLLQLGAPEEVYRRPRTPFVAGFLGGSNLIEAQADGLAAECPLGRIGLRAEHRGKVVLAVRPESLVVEPHENAAGEVVHREFQGRVVCYRVRYQEATLTAVSEDASITIGQRVQLRVRGPVEVVERR